MPTRELLERTEQRLAEVEALQQSLDQLGQELHAYREALRLKLAWLRSETPPPTVPAPVQPVPTPAPTPITGPERRTSPRRKGNPVSVRVSSSTLRGDACEGWVIDRSRGGLGVLVDESLPLGAILSIRSAKDDPHSRWIQVEVISCRTERNNWRLGCRFTRPLAWEDLRQFGYGFA